MISDSVELCKIEVSFLHIELIGTSVFLQKWILSLSDLLQNLSLETVPACIALQYYTHDNIVCIHKYEE